MSMDTAEVLTLQDLLQIFNIKMDTDNKFTANGITYKIKFTWKNWEPFAVTPSRSVQPDQFTFKDSQFAPIHSKSSKGPPLTNKSSTVGRIQTFISDTKKEELLESENLKELNVKHQQELRQRADAMIDSIKERKQKDNRIHLAFLYASPLVITLNDVKSRNEEDQSKPLMKIDFAREFAGIKDALCETQTRVNFYRA